MATFALDWSVWVFAATLIATFIAAYLGRRHSRTLDSAALSQQRLGKWLVGLSAGATANSGFVVTGAVGLGYSFGLHWLMLPLAWLLGDVVFWLFFPQRINRVGAEAGAITLTDVLVHDLPPASRQILKILAAVIILVCLSGYVSAQWLAGQKFLHGAFGFTDIASLLTFAAVIVAYTSIGGFRGSVYADSLQAIIRIIATTVAFGAVVWVASENSTSFWQNISGAGADFLSLFPQNSIWLVAAFILGFAAAGLGFGLGQPQLVTRYLAGESPGETQAAWWIYIGFVQYTWLLMTGFGVILRGVMPNLADPETGLSVFFRSDMGALLTGIIVADIFATISATSNSLLVAMAQTLDVDILKLRKRAMIPLWPVIALLGIVTMGLSLMLNSTVVSLALTSVSLMGAGLAPAMMIQVLGWRHNGKSIVFSVLCGLTTATIWKFFGPSAILNEAAPGIAVGLIVNFVVLALSEGSKALYAPRA